MTLTRIAVGLCLIAIAPWASAGESFEVSESTGQLYYEYHFDLPAASGRYQPELVIRYGGYDGEFGADWNGRPLLPQIALGSVPAGVVGAPNAFIYDDGRQRRRVLLPSARDGSGHYAADVEERYMDFWQVDADTWNARDAAGNTYTFSSRTPGYNWD